MTIETPEFQGTHLWDRLCWAKEKLEPYRTEYCVVWEDPETPDMGSDQQKPLPGATHVDARSAESPGGNIGNMAQ